MTVWGRRNKVKCRLIHVCPVYFIQNTEKQVKYDAATPEQITQHKETKNVQFFYYYATISTPAN